MTYTSIGDTDRVPNLISFKQRVFKILSRQLLPVDRATGANQFLIIQENIYLLEIYLIQSNHVNFTEWKADYKMTETVITSSILSYHNRRYSWAISQFKKNDGSICIHIQYNW